MGDDMDTKIEWIGRYVDDLKSRFEKLESEVEALKNSRTYYSPPCPCPSPLASAVRGDGGVMRPIANILRDVIEKLEPEDALPERVVVGGESPLGLHLSGGRGATGKWQWWQRVGVDTGELIDAAPSAGVQVGVSGDGNAFVYRGRDIVGRAASESTREAVILALAEALGVETEE